MKYIATVNGREYVIEINKEGEVTVDGRVRAVDFKALGHHALYSLLLDNASIEALVERRGDGYSVLMRGHFYTVNVTDERAKRLSEASTGFAPETGEINITAPMPGRIVAVLVEEGQEVKEGDKLVILESMKMENELKSPRAATVARVNVKPEDSVEQNQVLVVLV